MAEEASDSRGDQSLQSLRDQIAIEEAKLQLEFLRAAKMVDTSEERKKTFGWLAELFAHDYGEMLRIKRAAAAKGSELDPSAFSRPYPSPSSSTVTNTQGGVGGSLVAIALASGLGGAGLAAVLALQTLLNKPPPQAPLPSIPPPVVAEPKAEDPPKMEDQRYRVRVFWGEKEIGPQGEKATIE